MKNPMYKINKLFFLLFLTTFVIYGNENEQCNLTFSEAAELAVSSSADLKYSYASQALTEGAWKWGRRVYFPRLSFNISENDRLQQIGTDSFVKNYGINVDQLVFDGGRTYMSRKLEKLELNLSLSKLERIASEIAESAITAYRNILSSRAILEIKQAALVVLDEQRRILSEEVQLGLALAVDLANADINLAGAKLDIFSLQLELSEMERQFTELIGLETMPILTEKVDINRSVILPAVMLAEILVKERNPELEEVRHSITKKQAELKIISRSWIPNLRLSGSFGLSGQHYPLTHFNWSIGMSIDFSSPWLQSSIGTQTGWEPPYDKTAMIQNNFNPLPDPASGLRKDQARITLALEKDKYGVIIEQIGRKAVTAVEKCAIAEKKRILAIEAAALGTERCRIEKLRLNLGQITRINLTEILIEQTQREIAVVEAATALLEAERELERLLDLKPGSLALLTQQTLNETVQ
jgi:outer membrane protein TolC